METDGSGSYVRRAPRDGRFRRQRASVSLSIVSEPDLLLHNMSFFFRNDQHQGTRRPTIQLIKVLHFISDHLPVPPEPRLICLLISNPAYVVRLPLIYPAMDVLLVEKCFNDFFLVLFREEQILSLPPGCFEPNEHQQAIPSTRGPRRCDGGLTQRK